jgi:signal peptidase
MTRKKLVNAFLTALTLILILGAWTNFAPLQFGGQASYVVVAGASMEPSLQRGDLVVARQSSQYEIGDIVTYLHPKVGPVIHRVIDENGARFIVKGDNNDWIDTYQPTSSEVIGRAWLHLPNAGQYISKLRTPGWMALISVVLGLMIMTTILKDKEQKSRWLPLEQLPWENWQGWLSELTKYLETIFFLLSAIGLLSIVLAAVAFTRPIQVGVVEEIPYQHNGYFDYSAYVPYGVYNSNKIQSGEPVFLELTDRVRFQFTYQIEGEDLAAVSGNQRLLAEVSDINGWKRSLEIGPMDTFTGSEFESQGFLDISQVRSILTDLEEVTGLKRPHYILSVYPEIEVSGVLSGSEFSDQFSPRLEFLLDAVQLQLVRSNSPLEESNPLQSSASGVLERLKQVPNTISIFSLEFPVAKVRWIAGAGLLLTLLGGIGLIYLAKYSRHQGAPAEIQLKLNNRLVAIENGDLDNSSRVVQVASIEDLTRLADHEGQMILHEVRGTVHHYYLDHGELTYHFIAREPDDYLSRTKTKQQPPADEQGEPE